MSAKIKEFNMCTKRQQSDVDFLVEMVKLYQDTFDNCESNKEYVKFVNALHKAEDAARRVLDKDEKEYDFSKASDSEKKAFVKSILDEQYRHGFGGDGTKIMVKMVDKDNKIVAAVQNSRAISDQVESAIVDAIVDRNVVFAPSLIRELGQYWLYYGEKVPDNLVSYAGFDTEPWAYGRSLVQPRDMETPTWDTFLNRVSDKEAFAAWIYGVASKRYKGRQVLWLTGENGEDGKTFIQKIISQYVFANSTAVITNTMMNGDSQRFAAATLENKALATWGDCNNQQALMSEFVKAVSAGKEGDAASIERKGKDSYSGQLEARLWVNSNYDPIISNDNYAKSRLLFVRIKPLREAPDITLRDKFVSELPGFLEYGRACYEALCKDQRKIKQTSDSCEDIDNLTVNASLEYEAIMDQHFIVDPEGNAPAGLVSAILKKEGIKSNMALSWFYRWLEHTHKVVRGNVGNHVVLTGIRIKNYPEKAR